MKVNLSDEYVVVVSIYFCRTHSNNFTL